MADRYIVISAADAHDRGWHDKDCGFDRHGYPVEWGQDEGWELYDTTSTPPRFVGRDGGEPEDQLLVRDWEWVAEELNRLASEKCAERAIAAAVEAERDIFQKAARDFEEAIDNVRKALGLEATHYLVIADEVREVVVKLAAAQAREAKLRDALEACVESLIELAHYIDTDPCPGPTSTEIMRWDRIGAARAALSDAPPATTNHAARRFHRL